MVITFSQLGKNGRRGNAYFQAAATIALALKNNDDYLFPNCELKNTTNIPIDKFVNKINLVNTYAEKNFHYSEIIYQKDLDLFGYFQSYKYFKNFSNEINNLLTPNVDISKKEGYTSIHVRRTDYLIHKNCYNILNLENYYNKAMQLCGSDNKFLIFSDDIKLCKKMFIGSNFEFVEGNKPHVDMALMICCDNNIIANSSFSWWAGWLNNNSNKKVIYPKIWFGPDLAKTHNTKDLIPEGWIGI